MHDVTLLNSEERALSGPGRRSRRNRDSTRDSVNTQHSSGQLVFRVRTTTVAALVRFKLQTTHLYWQMTRTHSWLYGFRSKPCVIR